jgi:hypothetical protein
MFFPVGILPHMQVLQANGVEIGCGLIAGKI